MVEMIPAEREARRRTEAHDPPNVLAREALGFLLVLAYSGELGAARAYAGHRVALRDPGERAALGRILRDEIRHRRVIRRMLRALGLGPDPWRERKLDLVGKSISLFCRMGGWFLPMYGAGRLEESNIGEYEHAARLAHAAGLVEWADALLEMAEVEWDHEAFFRGKAASHPAWRVLPGWPAPPPRATIRERFAAWQAGPRAVEPVRAPWLVR